MLNKTLVKQGLWLFRWRSYLPFLLAPVAVAAVYQSRDHLATISDGAFESLMCVSLVISLIGLGFRSFIVGYVPSGTSGRNTREQRAEQLNTSGMYSVVRHPLYFANFLIFLGFVMALEVWWFSLLACFSYAVYYERIMMAEESFLDSKFGQPFRDWAERTPGFIPRPSLWAPPEMPFSFRFALRREYGSIYLVLAYFSVLKMLLDVSIREQSFSTWMESDPVWFMAFVISTLLFFILRYLKKHTRFLDVTDR